MEREIDLKSLYVWCDGLLPEIELVHGPQKNMVFCFIKYDKFN